MAEPDIIELLDENFVCLGVSSESNEGRIIINEFEMTEFPYISTIFVDKNRDFNFLGILETDNLTKESLLLFL